MQITIYAFYDECDERDGLYTTNYDDAVEYAQQHDLALYAETYTYSDRELIFAPTTYPHLSQPSGSPLMSL